MPLPYKILVLDSSEKHRQVIRHFIEKAYPGIELVEHDPELSGMPAANTDWSRYHLVLMDNQLGREDGLGWYKMVKQQKGFPRVIFVSSMNDPGSARATQAVIESIRHGAENFLFKKGISAKQLNSSILEALKKSGYNPDATIPDMESPVSGKESQADGGGGIAHAITREIDLNMNDTVLEMELAMAMLHGYAEWPFSMRDILAEKARLGDYKVTSYLGKTDCLSTFKAEHLKTGQKAVIKMLSETADQETEDYRKALQNLDESLKWKHPSLVHYLDHMMVEERLVIVQECLDGGKLSQLLATKGVTREQASHFILQILSALHELHRRGMVAGILTPDTLIFRDPDTLVITDPGIIGPLAPPGMLAKSQPLNSQICYSTPEKAQGRSVDQRSDLYSAGIIYYEMIAGYPPFHKGSIQDILYAHATQPVPDLPDKKSPANKVVKGLLMKTPAQRFQTAQEVIKLIQQINS